MLDSPRSLPSEAHDEPAGRPQTNIAQRGDTVAGQMTTLRIQQNILARRERQLLTWLCARMPAWITPDVLTALGVFGAVLVFGGYAASNLSEEWLWLAIAGYVVQWFGDSMDGSLARYRKIERPSYGYFIDHSCDGLTTALIVWGIGTSPYVIMDVVMVALVGYLLLSIHAYLAARVLGEFKLSYLAAGPTELRFLLVGLTIMMMVLGSGPGLFGAISGFDLFVGALGALMMTLFVVQTLITGRRLAREAALGADRKR
jgi:phosphatidylglycerophosphate synthase